MGDAAGLDAFATPKEVAGTVVPVTP